MSMNEALVGAHTGMSLFPKSSRVRHQRDSLLARKTRCAARRRQLQSRAQTSDLRLLNAPFGIGSTRESQADCHQADGPQAMTCTNCDGRKCMGCVLREYDHQCQDDCPFCCAEQNEERAAARWAEMVERGAEALRQWHTGSLALRADWCHVVAQDVLAAALRTNQQTEE